MNPICALEWDTKGQSKQKKPVCMCTQQNEHSLASPSASVQAATTHLHLRPLSYPLSSTLSSPGWAKPEEASDFCFSAQCLSWGLCCACWCCCGACSMFPGHTAAVGTQRGGVSIKPQLLGGSSLSVPP